MMMVVKRKQILTLVLIAFIALAGYVNYGGETEETAYMGEAQLVESSLDTETAGYFAQARLDREAGRTRSIETYSAIVSNSDADEESREQAQSAMLSLAEYTEVETAIENLIRAKGYEDAVCYISQNAISIVVKTGGLDSADAAKIAEIAAEQSGIPKENIKIVEMAQ